MTASSPSAAVAIAVPLFSDHARLALAGFLAGYRGLTREADTLDRRQFAAWCHCHDLRLFALRRTDIECSGRGGQVTQVAAAGNQDQAPRRPRQKRGDLIAAGGVVKDQQHSLTGPGREQMRAALRPPRSTTSC